MLISWSRRVKPQASFINPSKELFGYSLKRFKFTFPNRFYDTHTNRRKVFALIVYIRIMRDSVSTIRRVLLTLHKKTSTKQ